MFELKKDGILLFSGNENECFIKLLKIQSQSTHWALKYEGYSITKKK